jgi:hypothetical protein
MNNSKNINNQNLTQNNIISTLKNLNLQSQSTVTIKTINNLNIK